MCDDEKEREREKEREKDRDRDREREGKKEKQTCSRKKKAPRAMKGTLNSRGTIEMLCWKRRWIERSKLIDKARDSIGSFAEIFTHPIICACGGKISRRTRVSVEFASFDPKVNRHTPIPLLHHLESLYSSHQPFLEPHNLLVRIHCGPSLCLGHSPAERGRWSKQAPGWQRCICGARP